MPITAIVGRRVPQHPGGAPTFTPAMRNVRPQISYPQGPHDSPDPIRQSDFNYEGKPRVHAQSRQQIATAFNMASTLAIEEEEFRVQAWPRTNWTGTPPTAGGQNTWRERANVKRPAAVTYGSLFELQ